MWYTHLDITNCDHKWMPRGVCECGITAADIQQKLEQQRQDQEKQYKIQLHLELQTVEARNIVKDYLGVSRYSPIPIVLDGADVNSPPRFVGESYGYFTKGGTPIRYPSAYSKVGWSNMEYRHSTLIYAVGKEWLRQQFKD